MKSPLRNNQGSTLHGVLGGFAETGLDGFGMRLILENCGYPMDAVCFGMQNTIFCCGSLGYTQTRYLQFAHRWAQWGVKTGVLEWKNMEKH